MSPQHPNRARTLHHDGSRPGPHDAGEMAHVMQRVYAVVLAGGRGSRLHALTDHRAKPALPFAGKLNIIDFALSNCINSGIRRIGVLTQYKAQSLIRHIERGWGFLQSSLGEFIDVVPAQQQLGEGWYCGTANAVWQNLEIVREAAPELVLVLAGDHVYKMDYGRMIADHLAHRAPVTLACIDVPLDQPWRCSRAKTRYWPAWASTSSTPTSCVRTWRVTRRSRHHAMTSATTCCPTWCATTTCTPTALPTAA
jgi:CTP:molybdopterin cytidylyltransferase MocA